MSLAIAGGLFTAIAEGGLFAIYYNRRENARKFRQKRREKQKERLLAKHRKQQGISQTEGKAVESESDTAEVPELILDDQHPTDAGPLRRRRKADEEGEAIKEES